MKLVSSFLLCLTLSATASAAEIKLTGAPNFREVSGYRTAQGFHIKPHLLFRSGQLSGLTPEDYRVLSQFHLRYVFDLRTDEERAAEPTRWSGASPQFVSVSLVDPDAGGVQRLIQELTLGARNAASATAAMQQATARIAIDGAHGIGKIVSAIADGNIPALIHCAAGKDRTGVTVAVLMTILGVNREDVFREYELTNQARLSTSSSLVNVPQDARRVLMRADHSFLEAAFRAIDMKYGSFDSYVRKGLKLSDATVNSLQKRLLE